MVLDDQFIILFKTWRTVALSFNWPIIFVAFQYFRNLIAIIFCLSHILYSALNLDTNNDSNFIYFFGHISFWVLFQL